MLLPHASPLPLCSDALRCGTSPELAAALQGVSQAKVFVGGEARRDKLTVIVPGRGSYKLADVGQDDLERFLDVVGNVWLRDRRWQSR